MPAMDSLGAAESECDPRSPDPPGGATLLVQEAAIRAVLTSLGHTLGDGRALEPGQFGKETKFGRAKADGLIRLRASGRHLVIEAKVSGTEVNSEKRINHEGGLYGSGSCWRLISAEAVVPQADAPARCIRSVLPIWTDGWPTGRPDPPHIANPQEPPFLPHLRASN